MTKIAVLLSGRGSNFITLDKAVRYGAVCNAQIACVISNKKGAPGLAYAADSGLNTFVLLPADFPNREAYDKELLKILKAHDIDLICLAGYMRIVSNIIIDEYYGRIMNIHPSLLPSFPGLDAQKQALEYGVKITGCTVHFVDNGMDTGPIILQQSVQVLPDDTVDTLSERILAEEHKLYPHAVQLFTSGRLELVDKKVIIKDE